MNKFSSPNIIDSATKLSSKIGTFPHQYRLLTRSPKTEHIFQKLLDDGFFKFHPSNLDCCTVYLHQIVAFYYCGGIHALKRGFRCVRGFYEVHHLDGDTSNNHPSNLRYLSTVAHQFITKYQRQIIKNIKMFSKQSMKELSVISVWNNRGKAVKDIPVYIASLLVATLASSSLFKWDIVTAHVKSLIKEIKHSFRILISIAQSLPDFSA